MIGQLGWRVDRFVAIEAELFVDRGGVIVDSVGVRAGDVTAVFVRFADDLAAADPGAGEGERECVDPMVAPLAFIEFWRATKLGDTADERLG